MRAWIFVVTCALACSSSPTIATQDGPTAISTDKGVVEGSVTDDGVREWLGIPFAAPPVGALRFKPPEDVTAWSTPIVANAAGAECAQLGTDGKTVAAGSSEDCLYLNVWAPKSDVHGAPVFVWIYGGGFTIGSGSDPLYSGENVVADLENVIVVTINYRLGPLGWLSHTELATEDGVLNVASQGLQDQQAALAWVHRNIAAFGGDPSNVTIAGESAGAISTCAELAMPGSSALFAHAVIESGVCFSDTLFTPPAAATAQGTRLATALSCAPGSVMSCLRAASVSDLLGALPLRIADFGPTGEAWGPTVDGTLLPMIPADAVTAGQATKVPIIIGTNENEGDLFAYLFQLSTNAPVTSTDVRASLDTVFGAAAVDQIAAQYPVDSDPPTAFANIITDGVFVCPTRRFARAYAASGGTAYLYQFTYPYEVAAIPNITASHSYEIPFVFRNGYLGTQLGDDDITLANHIDAYWFSGFAQKGDPNVNGELAWPVYSQATDTNIVFDKSVSTQTGLKATTCDFWDSITP